MIEVIRDEWSQIGADPNHKILRALCESMPRRLEREREGIHIGDIMLY